MRIVSKRTTLLLCGAALAPAAVFLARNYVREAEYEAIDEGALAVAVWVDIGTPIVIMFLLGIISFFSAAISLVFDFRRSRNEPYPQQESTWKL